MRPSRAVGASFGPALLALAWLTAGDLAADPPTAMASTGGPPPPAVEYTLDPSSSALYVQVHKDPATLAAGLSHDHVVTSTGWSGRVRWDPADVAA